VVFGEHIRRVLLVVVLVVTALSAAGATLLPALWWAVAFETVMYVTAVVVLLGVARRDGSTAGDSALAGSSWALLRWGGAFTVVTLASAAIPQAGIWLLAGFAPVEEVAVLSVAVRIALLLITPAALAMRTLAPRIAAAHEAGRLPVLEDVLRRSAVWSTAATALAVAVIAATGSWLLPRVFGPAYADALPPTLLLAVGVLVNAWTGPCSVLLSHAGHQRTVAISSLMSGVAFCGLSVWWGRLGGADGAAAAAAVVMSVRNLWLARTARRVLGVRTIAVPRRRKE
jgi:O-antigen/teichoic acid export membrane protein